MSDHCRICGGIILPKSNKDVHDICAESEMERMAHNEVAVQQWPAVYSCILKEDLDLLQANHAELLQAVRDLMVGQEFDHGGHITKRVPPTHSAVIKARGLLYRLDKNTTPAG